MKYEYNNLNFKKHARIIGSIKVLNSKS